MKKYILSFLVIGTFGLYVLYLRIGGSSDVAILPTTTTQPSVPTDTPTPDTPQPEPTDTPIILPTETPTATKTPVATKKPTPTPTKTPVATIKPTPTPTPKPVGQYKDGTYTGLSENAYYGYIQVEAVIQGGKLTDVQFLDYPQDRGTSVRINSHAMPILRSEAISAQSSNVNTVSGASDSSGAFRQSLASALSQAKNG